MSHRNKTFIFILVSLSFLVGIFYVYYDKNKDSFVRVPSSLLNKGTDDASGYGTDSVRVDSQITLKIPEGEADEVYKYLRDIYIDNNKVLKRGFPDLHLFGEQREDVSQFTDSYFDTKNLDLYKAQNNVRYRYRINTTDPNDRKSGRELVQVKITPPGQFTMRTELKLEVKEDKNKFEKLTSEEAKDELHPLIQLINKSQRQDFKNTLTESGIDPYSLHYVITNDQTRSRIYLDWNTENIISLSVDEGEADKWWAHGKISSIDIGLVETVYTEASPEKRKKMEKIRDYVLMDLKSQFPDLTENSEEKYALLLNQIKDQIPFFELLFRIRFI